MKNFTQKFIGLLALVFTMSFTVNSQEIGEVYQGGYIFYIDETGEHGLVAAMEDLEGLFEWGCSGTTLSGADGQVIGTGLQNTLDIVSGCTETPIAASVALAANLNEYTDWYLPSLDELIEMYNTIGQGGAEGNIGGFFDNWYWSSSEGGNEDGAWDVYFNYGGTGSNGKNLAGRVRVIRSVTFGEDEELATQNIPLDLPEGWSMFGYTCLDSVDAMVGFSSISDKIEIVKDEWGLSYLPSWDFNAMGSLQFSEGYQIKMIEGVDGFHFCSTIVTPEDGIGQADVDAAYEEGAASVTPEDGVSQADLDALAASYAGWCESDTDNDGICDADEVTGCMNITMCNYVAEAEYDDGSCYNNDLGCGCDTPAPTEGFDCDGNELAIIAYEIGDLGEGGIVFYIDESGEHGLVAALEDLGSYQWGCYEVDISGADGHAIGTGYQNTLDIVSGCSETNIQASQASIASFNSYTDWYLPSNDELLEMYNTIGASDAGGNFASAGSGIYWSSTEESSIYAWVVHFGNGGSNFYRPKHEARFARVIRAF